MSYGTIRNRISGILLPKPRPTFTLPYKVYSAILNQGGINAPIATVLENSLSGSIVWTRVQAGFYRGTLTGAFTQNKTLIFIDHTNGNSMVVCGRENANIIAVSTRNLFASVSGGSVDHADADGLLNGASIEIRVYN